MVRNRATREVREVLFDRDPTKPTRQAKMTKDNLASYRTSAEVELSSFQTGWVEVKFGKKPILVSRRTFSEVARSQAPTIIYTYYDDIGQKQIVFVGFNPTTKTYKILSFQFSNSTTTNSSTEIKPSTEEGKAWIRCLREAYPYYNFQQAKIQTEYET